MPVPLLVALAFLALVFVPLAVLTIVDRVRGRSGERFTMGKVGSWHSTGRPGLG